MIFEKTKNVTPQVWDEEEKGYYEVKFKSLEITLGQSSKFFYNNESKFEIFTRKISKLYQNNVLKYTIPKWAKLWQEWKSYYNRIKTTILGEK